MRDLPWPTPAAGIALTRAVHDIGGRSSVLSVGDETIERIITGNPFAHWWHTNPLG